MIDWHDPEVEYHSAHVALFIGVVCVGCYGWEFLTSFWFDWQYITRKRTIRWTTIPYFIARYAALASLVLGIRVANVFGPIDTCTAWWKSIYACADSAMAGASLLLIHRVVAIAGNRLWVRVFLLAFWLADVGVLLSEIIQIRGAYAPTLLACGTINTTKGSKSDSISLALYVCCLGLVFAFLARTPGAGLVQLLRTQGVVYFVAVMVAFVPAVILFALDLNDSISGLLQPVTMVVMVICATRMYRDLVRYDERTANSDTFVLTSTHIGWAAANTHSVSGGRKLPAGFVGSTAESVREDEGADPQHSLGTTRTAMTDFSLSRSKIVSLEDHESRGDQHRDSISNDFHSHKMNLESV